MYKNRKYHDTCGLRLLTCLHDRMDSLKRIYSILIDFVGHKYLDIAMDE